jgi:hypothetical protein
MEPEAPWNSKASTNPTDGIPASSETAPVDAACSVRH